MSSDPIRKFNACLARARQSGAPLAEAGALATADRRGRPSVRFMLLKGADAEGFVFYTNNRSRKGRELKRNRRVSMAFYWDATGVQVRVEGPVGEVSVAEADDYWAERPRDSQIASAASKQSAPLASRAKLTAKVRRLKSLFRGLKVPRPANWTGYRIIADRIEFWHRREPRLHHRELYRRRRGVWEKTLLEP